MKARSGKKNRRVDLEKIYTSYFVNNFSCSVDWLFKIEGEDSIRFPTTGSSITGIAVLYFVS